MPNDRLPTKNIGKFIAEYVLNDEEHLGVELRRTCRDPPRRRTDSLREVVHAAIDNIEYAWERPFKRVLERDITDAMKRLRRQCPRLRR